MGVTSNTGTIINKMSGCADERDAGCGWFRMAGDVQETNNIIPVMNPPNWIITVSKNRAGEMVDHPILG